MRDAFALGDGPNILLRVAPATPRSGGDEGVMKTELELLRR
jgi:hypothetical protein